MRASLAHLIGPLAIDGLGRGRRQRRAGTVPLVVRGADIELARRHDEGAAQLERGQVLADAVLGAELKGAVGGLGRVQGVGGIGGGGEPALGQEFVRAVPVGRVAVQGLVEDPHESAASRVAAAVRVEEVDPGRAFAQRRRRRE